MLFKHDKLIYCNIILLVVLVYILNSVSMDPMDQIIFKYLVFNDENAMLSKYRDYFPLLNCIPRVFDSAIFTLIFLFYIPIVVFITVVQYIYSKNGEHFMNKLHFNIKHPLMLSKGMVYNGILPYFYCMKLNTKLNNDTFNKLSWDTLFKENSVPTPQILGSIIDGKINNKDINLDNKKAIIKPIQGCCGNGVSIYDKNNIPTDMNYIIQEMVNVMHENESRSYRIVTNCYQNKITLWDIYLLRSNSIATNISQGGNIYKYIDNKKQFINSNHEIIKLCSTEHKYLMEAIENAKKCHGSLLFCPTIGWDVIIGKKGGYFLEGNIGVTISCNVDNHSRESDYIDFINPIFRYIMR